MNTAYYTIRNHNILYLHDLYQGSQTFYKIELLPKSIKCMAINPLHFINNIRPYSLQQLDSITQ